MTIFDDYLLPDLLIKVCSREEYVEDIRHGKIYMNESGYFRKLEDNFRGDRLDGKSPINLESLREEKIILEPKDGPSKRIEIPIANVSNFTVGFERDDKIPIFCCSLVSEEILEIESDGVLKFRKEYIEEMSQFGEYYAIFSFHEFVAGLKRIEKETGFMALGRKVQYVNIKEEYLLEILNNQDRSQYEPFFKKDQNYYWQNEWRVLFHRDNSPIISDQEDHYIAQIPEFDWFISGNMEEIKQARIVFQQNY